MKPREIEALRALPELDPLWMVQRNCVLRLLEERDMLLEALKIEPHCCGQAQVKKDHETRAVALALAES